MRTPASRAVWVKSGGRPEGAVANASTSRRERTDAFRRTLRWATRMDGCGKPYGWGRRHGWGVRRPLRANEELQHQERIALGATNRNTERCVDCVNGGSAIRRTGENRLEALFAGARREAERFQTLFTTRGWHEPSEEKSTLLNQRFAARKAGRRLRLRRNLNCCPAATSTQTDSFHHWTEVNRCLSRLSRQSPNFQNRTSREWLTLPR